MRRTSQVVCVRRLRKGRLFGVSIVRSSTGGMVSGLNYIRPNSITDGQVMDRPGSVVRVHDAHCAKPALPPQRRPLRCQHRSRTRTLKAFHIIAQGREPASAPWVRVINQCLCPEGTRSFGSARLIEPFQGSGHLFTAHPGCASRPWALRSYPFRVLPDSA
jgi:hypothetical protein